MGKRLFLVGFLAASLACQGSRSGTQDERNGDMRDGSQAEMGGLAMDPVERALESLVEGRVQRLDLNEAPREGRMRITQAHLAGDLLLLETDGERPNVFALGRRALEVLWVSQMREPSMFPATANDDTVMLISKHYAHAFEAATGNSSFQFVRGDLAGIARDAIQLPYIPTGGAAVGNDSFYLVSLGNPTNNKNLEAFSLVTGDRGWGYRARGSLLTSPVRGGDAGDPKVYFVSRSGLVTCLDATNYGYAPRGERWQELLEARVTHGLFVTDDSRRRAGSVLAVDDEGVVYCLDRITGDRRWVSATGRKPAGGPQVFGDVCVVKMESGLTGFDAVNVAYAVEVENGPDAGRVHWIRASGDDLVVGSAAGADIQLRDPKVAEAHATLKISGEILTITSLGDEENLIVDRAPTGRATLVNGSRVKLGDTILRIRDRGTGALWHDLDYDEIVARVGPKLIARRGNRLTAIDAWTGEPVGDPVDVDGLRLMPANTSGTNLFLVAGDAVVYALFTR